MTVCTTKDGRRINVGRTTRRDVNLVAELWRGLADERKCISTEYVSWEQKERKSVDNQGR
ncbi:MAG: hypothetical protein ABSB29_08665 [Nitrososphaerales archaeon]